MNVDLLLPCIRFEVIIYPSDPNQATDLEAAALYFIRHHEDLGGTSADALGQFLCMGEAVLDDMLVRMVNRGWVRIAAGAKRTLRLSSKARELLDSSTTDGPEPKIPITSTEEGKRFWVCYDLIGGGYAVINRRSLTRALEDPRAVPRQRSAEGNETAPYGKRLDGFLPARGDAAREDLAETNLNNIIRALQADRFAREYLQDSVRGAIPHVIVPAPSRPLTLDDVLFYKCRFDVVWSRIVADPDSEDEPPAISLSGEQGSLRASGQSGSPESEIDQLPELVCVEPRNRWVRRLGEANADRIVDLAMAAARDGDRRFLKQLHLHARERAASLDRLVDPLQTLRDRLVKTDDTAFREDLTDTLDEIREIWALASDRVRTMVESRIDFSASKVVSPENFKKTIEAAIGEARNQITIASPRIRLRSSALALGTESIRHVLFESAMGENAVAVLIHGVTGATRKGIPFSDDDAINRLRNSFGREQVHVVERSLEHARSPFVLMDNDLFMLQNSGVFDDQVPRSLMIKLHAGSRFSSIGQLSRNLPPAFASRVEAGRASAHADETRSATWPSDVEACVRDVEAILARYGTADISELAPEVLPQLDFLQAWIEGESDAFEPVVGARIMECAHAMLGPGSDHETLVIGLSGWTDSQAIPELTEAVSLRLTRQFTKKITDVATVICLPQGTAFDTAMAYLEQGIGQPSQVKIHRQSVTPRSAYPMGFVLSDRSAVIAADGLFIFVPTAGRKVKGTNVGAQFLGPNARALAARFLAQEWPAAATEILSASGAGPRAVRNPSKTRKSRLLQMAAEEAWYKDGNRGANRARAAILDVQRDGKPAWAPFYSEARVFLSDDSGPTRALGYALMKAVALAEHDGEIGPIGALSQLARQAVAQEDLLVAAVLADHLPEASIFRDPLIRKLSFAVARGQPPVLTHDEISLLGSPSRPALALSALLMMDGLGREIAEWLAYLDIRPRADALERFTATLAAYVTQTDACVIDLRHLTSRRESLGFDQAVERLREEIASARIRSDIKLPEQVLKLRKHLFERKGAFASDLLDLIESFTPDLQNDERARRLEAFLKTAKTDLGVDLLAAGSATAATVKPERVASDYFSKNNAEMAQAHKVDQVNVDKGGRNIETSLKKILELLVNDLVPVLVEADNQLETELIEAAAHLLSATPSAETEEGMSFEALLRKRIEDPNVTQNLISQPWLVPLLGKLEKNEWKALQGAFLRSEFERGTSFHHVVNWLVEQDRRQEIDGAKGDIEYLLVLHDLLDTADSHAEQHDLDAAWDALGKRLDEIAGKIRVVISDVEAFVQAIDEPYPEDALLQQAQRTKAAHDALMGHLADSDLISAMLQADDIRKGELADLLDEWECVSRKLREKMAGKIVGEGEIVDSARAELRRILPLPVRAEALNRARRFVKVGPRVWAPITLNEDAVLNVRDGRPVTEGMVSEGASPLVNLLAQIRDCSAKRGVTEAQAASAIAAFFSNLDPSALLPVAKIDGRFCHVTCSHSAIVALTFGDAHSVEFTIPLERDDDLGLRTAASKSKSELAPISIAGRQAGPRDTRRGATPPASTQKILVSTFINEVAPNYPTLSWRDLVRSSGLPTSLRRICALERLARQRFCDHSELQSWWRDYGHDRRALLATLLSLSSETMDDSFSESEFVSHFRNLCIVFGLNLTRCSGRPAITPRGASALARILPGRDDGREIDGAFDVRSVEMALDHMIMNTQEFS